MDRRGKISEVMRWWALAWVCAALVGARAAGDEPTLKEYPSKYYLIHTDLSGDEVREAKIRMTRMAEEYQRRTAGFSGQITTRLPFYLYKDQAEYLRAGGAENSAGFFDGQQLMALTLRREDGLISLATWNVVQHEGFHQFAHAVIGGELPMWADEGLAEYFGEGLFTGDGFVTGLIPQSRLVRVQKMFVEAKEKPLREFMAITREQWNAKVEMSNYDQAWSFVHFLAHGEDGRLQKAFANYMKEVGKGEDAEKAYNRYLGAIPKLEERWKQWWIGLGDRPTADEYARATLAMLTSFLGRAQAQGQAFGDFDAFVKTPAANLKQGEEDWLPLSLFGMAVVEAERMRREGAVFVLVKAGDRPASIIVTLTDGVKLAGRFEVEGGQVEKVRTEVVVTAPVRGKK